MASCDQKAQPRTDKCYCGDCGCLYARQCRSTRDCTCCVQSVTEQSKPVSNLGAHRLACKRLARTLYELSEDFELHSIAELREELEKAHDLAEQIDDQSIALFEQAAAERDQQPSQPEPERLVGVSARKGASYLWRPMVPFGETTTSEPVLLHYGERYRVTHTAYAGATLPVLNADGDPLARKEVQDVTAFVARSVMDFRGTMTDGQAIALLWSAGAVAGLPVYLPETVIYGIDLVARDTPLRVNGWEPNGWEAVGG